MACDMYLQRAPKSGYLVGCIFVLGASCTRWACCARGLGIISRIDDQYDGTSFPSSLKARASPFQPCFERPDGVLGRSSMQSLDDPFFYGLCSVLMIVFCYRQR